MEGLLNFIGIILDAIGLIQWAGSKSRKERSKADGVYGLGVISGFLGSVAVLLLVVGITSLVGGNSGAEPIRMINKYFCLHLIAVPLGALFGWLGKASSNRIREKFYVRHVNVENFTKKCVFAFGFLGSALYTMVLYCVVIFTAQ